MEECHCDPRVQDRHGDTPLHVACLRNGTVGIVRFLIVDQHCDPACHGRWGRTPLHYACETGKLDIVKFLVEECHCDPLRVDNFNVFTPLHRAAHLEEPDVVTFLLSCVPPLKLVNSVSRHLLQIFVRCPTECPLEGLSKSLCYTAKNVCSCFYSLVVT